MKNRIRVLLFILLIFAQIVINKYIDTLKLNVDLLYLIIVYISIKKGIVKTVIFSSLIGWATDFFTCGVIGVFGFSRVVIAFLINEVFRYIDLRKNVFVFLFIAISLAISNLIANIFLYFIFDYKIMLSLIVYQPVLTGFVGMILNVFPKMKKVLNVY